MYGDSGQSSTSIWTLFEGQHYQVHRNELSVKDSDTKYIAIDSL